MPRDEYTDYAPRPTQRWDAVSDRDDRDRDHPRDTDRYYDDRPPPPPPGPSRPSRRRSPSPSSSVADSRRAPPRGGVYEDDYIRERSREREVYRDDPRDLPVRSKTTVERETERERAYYRDPSPERVRRPVRTGRPTMLRRQSSLDTFDRRTTQPRYMQREESGPLAVRGERGGFEEDRAFSERVREREVVRPRRRSRSRSLSSSSGSEFSQTSTVGTGKSRFPKRGKTRMPARMVSKRAIIELGYPFLEEDSTIIIQKALGREHIDEVLQLSEKYRRETKTEHTDKIIEETHTERIYAPPAPAPPPPAPPPIPPPIYSPPPTNYPQHLVHVPTPPPPAPRDYSQVPEIIHVSPRNRLGPPPASTDLVTTTTNITTAAIYDERYGYPHRHHHRSRSMGPTPRHEEYIDSSLTVAPIPVFPEGKRRMHSYRYDSEGRVVRVERIRDAEYARDEGGEVVLYERDAGGGEPVAAVRRDRKGRMSLVVSKRYR
ncbi:hypothetical protein VE03_07460 [Pseudogymnoascus sp. 23342-1-I1]|nr:hypothetical protein VE03_07460 [Pseudogymnoascus sp. 23342-1-I1]